MGNKLSSRKHTTNNHYSSNYDQPRYNFDPYEAVDRDRHSENCFCWTCQIAMWAPFTWIDHKFPSNYEDRTIEVNYKPRPKHPYYPRSEDT